MTTKQPGFYGEGLVYTGPGRSHWATIGPFSSSRELKDAVHYWQAHRIYVVHVSAQGTETKLGSF